jgi:cysteine desulfurase / selenocysteine lyase
MRKILTLDDSSWRNDFAFYANERNKDVVYLDSAATTLKPISVVHEISDYYSDYPANVHRGLYPTSVKATELYEDSRLTTASYINAKSNEIVFTKSATEAFNFLATSLVSGRGDGVAVTVADHHSNFVPWQQAVKKHKARFQIAMIDVLNDFDNVVIDKVVQSITDDITILCLPLVTNVFGAILPVTKIIRSARKKNNNLTIVVDACQAVVSHRIDVRLLDCDFLIFSGHKLFGPTGVGVMYGRSAKMKTLSQYQFGGDMVDEVDLRDSKFKSAPHGFEAGTPPIASVIGLRSAIKYVDNIRKSHDLSQFITDLTEYAVDAMHRKLGYAVELYVPKNIGHTSIISFNLQGTHSHDVAQVLADMQICIRAGHHCAQPLHEHHKLISTCRASLSIYNTTHDIDKLITGIKQVISIFVRKK